MDFGLRTPLLDQFRRGEVAREVRLLAAQGRVAPRALEQLGILAILTADSDVEIRATADATLAAIPAGVLAAFIARSDVPAELREFLRQARCRARAGPRRGGCAPRGRGRHQLRRRG